MSSRTATGLNWLDLPTLDHPQYVTDEGYELAEAPIEEEELIEEEAVEAEDVVMEGEEKPGVAEPEPGDIEEDIGSAEPLLSIADSLVFVQSLRQSRQRHMQRLIPLIFTHPPLPSYNKPRARGPPRSTFTFPTPAPPTAPLPYREYHGPREGNTGAGASSPGASSPKPIEKGEDGKATSAARTQARAKRAAELDEVAPAHETECIARVTLTIGAFSYPETEIWIGRFVEPRADTAKVIKAEKRARMMTGEVEAPKKRDRPAKPYVGAPMAPVRPSTTVGMAARPTSGLPPIGQMRPPYPSMPNAIRPNPVLGPRPNPSTDAAINPDLIRKVNLAASTRPWLSDIIHKAARKQASKEELARLGVTVGRLNRGESVDGPGNAVAGPSRPPSSASSAVVPPAPPPATTRSDSPLTSENGSGEETSEDDREVNTRGPPQVGGGPVPESYYSRPPVTAPPPISSSGNPSFISRPSYQGGYPSTSSQNPSTFIPYRPSPVVPQSQPARPMPNPSTSQGSGYMPQPRPPPYSVPSQSTASTQMPMPPPPPPRPIYPKVPPFLLIAFKDAPTEKFLLPLGANSFISRTGGDHVTHPPPRIIPPPIAVAAPIPAPAEPIIPAPATPVTPVESPVNTGAKGKLRTRVSLGRGGKGSETPVPEVKPKPAKKEEKVEEPEVVAEVEQAPARPPPPPLKPGTVTVAMFMPPGEWEKPDWAGLEKGLPWFQPPRITPLALPNQVTAIPQPSISSSSVPTPDSSNSLMTPTSRISAPILNLGAIDLTPSEGDLQPTTIQLSGIDDHVWSRIKQVVDIVEAAELSALEKKEPELLRVIDTPSTSSTPQPTLSTSKPGYTPGQQQVRHTYLERKKARFTRLLSRAPKRSFLRLRTEWVDPALIEATSDKWAPRPYPITTKALYTRSPPPDDEMAYNNPYSPEKPAKKRKSNAAEPAVAFEMPVSLDALDEMVEEGAKFAIGRKKAGRVKSSGARKPRASKADGDGPKKPRVSRTKPGAVCEGCASTGLKVWRKGPGGKGTLCKDCGDAYMAGTLGELKAPGAMAELKQETEAGPSTQPTAVPDAEDSLGGIAGTSGAVESSELSNSQAQAMPDIEREPIQSQPEIIEGTTLPDMTLPQP